MVLECKCIYNINETACRAVFVRITILIKHPAVNREFDVDSVSKRRKLWKPLGQRCRYPTSSARREEKQKKIKPIWIWLKFFNIKFWFIWPTVMCSVPNKFWRCFFKNAPNVGAFGRRPVPNIFKFKSGDGEFAYAHLCKYTTLKNIKLSLSNRPKWNIERFLPFFMFLMDFITLLLDF